MTNNCAEMRCVLELEYLKVLDTNQTLAVCTLGRSTGRVESSIVVGGDCQRVDEPSWATV